MLLINNYYKDKKGITYDNIRDIHFENKEDITGNLGKFITETKYEPNTIFGGDNITDGVYIYLSKFDNDKALRIYKDWADYQFTLHDDSVIVSELQKRQNKIKLTDFPTGIITIENNVIGQEIPYYKDYKTLSEQAKISNKKDLLIYYQQIIKILKELYNNDIIYGDIHAKNFLVKDDIKLIDFEGNKVNLNKDANKYKEMLDKLIIMMNLINNRNSIDFKLANVDSLEDVERQLKLVK